MLELLAQHQQPTWLEQTVERLARTPIDRVLLFALVCTAARVGLQSYMLTRSRANHIGIPYGVLGILVAGIGLLFLNLGILPLALLAGIISVPLLISFPKTYNFDLAAFLHDISDALVYAGILVFMLIRPYAVQTFKIPSESMVPTLRINDYLIVNKAIYRLEDPQAGDIVVFKPPIAARSRGDDPNVDYVKRLIGVPGQTVEIRDSKLYRDGVPVNEPYVKDSVFGNFKLVEYPPRSGKVLPLIRDPDGYIPNRSLYADLIPPDEREIAWSQPAQPIPPGKYLMVGDNRNASFDGRFWGLIDRYQIVGKAWVIFWPFSRMGVPD